MTFVWALSTVMTCLVTPRCFHEDGDELFVVIIIARRMLCLFFFIHGDSRRAMFSYVDCACAMGCGEVSGWPSAFLAACRMAGNAHAFDTCVVSGQWFSFRNHLCPGCADPAAILLITSVEHLAKIPQGEQTTGARSQVLVNGFLAACLTIPLIFLFYSMRI